MLKKFVLLSDASFKSTVLFMKFRDFSQIDGFGGRACAKSSGKHAHALFTLSGIGFVINEKS